MAQPLASITNLASVLQYATESAAVAATKCPAAVQAYNDAAALASSFIPLTMSGDMAGEANYVETVRQAILAANNVCRGNLAYTTEGATQSTTDIQEDIEGSGGGGGEGSGGGGGGMSASVFGMPLWLLGLGAAGLMWYLYGKDKKGGRKGGGRKRSTKRTARRPARRRR